MAVSCCAFPIETVGLLGVTAIDNSDAVEPLVTEIEAKLKPPITIPEFAAAFGMAITVARPTITNSLPAVRLPALIVDDVVVVGSV